MGREPVPTIHPETSPSPSEGALNPTAWSALILARVNRSDTGTLVARHGDTERVFRFIRGTPVSAISSADAEHFTETLVGTGGLERARLNWIRKHTGVDETEVEALVGAGTITRSVVDAHHATHIEHLIAATLAWPSGEFSWTPSPAIDERFEQNLLPEVSAISGLMNGVLGGFDMGALHTFVDSDAAGDYLPDPRMTGGTPPSWIPADLKGVHSVLGQGETRFQMAATLGCDPERLAALLWILTATGWAHRAKPPAALIPLGSVAIIQHGAAEPAPPVETTAAPVPPVATAPAPASAKPSPSPQPTSTENASPPPDSPPPARPNTPAVAPAAAVSMPQTPTQSPTPNRKPPVARAPAPVDTAKGLDEAKAFIDASDFDAAYALLTKVRRNRPSCPDTLAALGWSAWRTGNLGTNAYDGPEDYLLLALTFDAQHPNALEYYARIAIEKGEKENARNRLLQLLKASPDSSWAQEALDELTPKNSSKGGLRLWPKGG